MNICNNKKKILGVPDFRYLLATLDLDLLDTKYVLSDRLHLDYRGNNV